MTDAPANGEAPARRCDYCRLPLPDEPVTSTQDGDEYQFCTKACLASMEDSGRVFTTYRGHRWFRPGVAALDAKLPQGLLRNSFVLLSCQPGSREDEFQAELVWRALERGEPVVVVTFTEPPIGFIEQCLTLGWNVLPYLEAGKLHFLDCFTYRVEDRDRMFSRMNDWSQHLYTVAESEITTVRDPTNVSEIENRLDDCTEAKNMRDQGIVLIDSLTEFGSLVQPVHAYDFIKDLRADVCKGRFVPVFACATYMGDADQFPHDLEYMFDGIVDMELNTQLVEDTIIKRARVRKMSGVLVYPEWTAYEFTSNKGLVMFDPQAELEKKAEETVDEEESPAVDEDDSGTDE